MASWREEIEEILVDCYGEDEQMSAWEVAFTACTGRVSVEVWWRARKLGLVGLAGRRYTLRHSVDGDE